jgi:AcrR family transcriptional regulator
MSEDVSWLTARPEDVGDTYGRLLAAALSAFAARGFHGTTTRDIAGLAGVSPAALYVHFPSKVDVLETIMRAGLQAALEVLVGSLAGVVGPVERMHGLVYDFVSWHAEHHAVARVVQSALPVLDESRRTEILAIRRQFDQLVRDEIEAGVASGDFVVTDSRDAARAVLSLAIDVSRWYSERSRMRPAELAAAYAELVARMLGVPPDAATAVRGSNGRRPVRRSG